MSKVDFQLQGYECGGGKCAMLKGLKVASKAVISSLPMLERQPPAGATDTAWGRAAWQPGAIAPQGRQTSIKHVGVAPYQQETTEQAR